ncbi:MAG TPA: hypothetical protein VGW38_28315 [Chloroflexota bacterium]|nr:hypothetical protein [Chloroflexota bacterium]
MIWKKTRAKAETDLDAVEFQVIGELGNDPGHLLLMCGDGRWYDYDLVSEKISPITPDDSWAVDVIDNGSVMVKAERELVAS